MTRGRHKEGDWVNTSINLSKDIYDWISEFMDRKGITTRKEVIEDALRAYIATVDRDPLTRALEQCYEWCGKRQCDKCPVLDSCAKYLEAEALASFALEGLMEISKEHKNKGGLV